VADKPVIFISYSHLDEPEHPRADEVQWLTFVQRFLRPAVKDGRFEVWVDRHMAGGADWNAEIEHQLRECDVFVLLVSANSMASDYVIDKEIAIIRERQENGEKVHFYPIMLTPTPQAGRDKVKDRNLRPKDGVPLSRVKDRLQDMSDIADEIAAIIAKIAKERGAAAPRRLTSVAGVKVEIGGLPETPYVNLVGRDNELKQLDVAWDNSQVNIVSLVAEGGAGKSSLLNEWLVRLQARGYSGAAAVLGWSFYSQGSKERATSAEGFLNWAVDKLDLAPASNSSSAKGAAIAEALANRQVLLALDGVEPLQHGPGPELGKLKDDGLRELLRRVAATPAGSGKGLIVLTTRTTVSNIERWHRTSAPVIDLDKLSDDAGIALLKDNGVWGTARQLTDAVQAFHGHALALSLLAGFLRETQNGDVRRRDHVRQIAHDDDDPRHAHAKRVIKSYADEWLAKEPVLDAIMALVGLFDRPADAGCLGALRQVPAIGGLTDPLVVLDQDSWNKAVARLRAARLLLPPDLGSPDALDAHPLVREWFGERLKATNETAWREAHGRLYEHLRDNTKEGDKPRLEDLAPLYQAIAYGCRAKRHNEVLQKIYFDRICRGNEYYSTFILGAVGSDLAAVSWFFDNPFRTPVETISTAVRPLLLNDAAFSLRSGGRLGEALSAAEASFKIAESQEDWSAAAFAAVNLGETQLLVGDVSAAVKSAVRAVSLANRGSDTFQRIVTLVSHADALHAAGDLVGAEKLFAVAEKLDNSQLTFLQGYRYCFLLLSTANWVASRDRARSAHQVAIRSNRLLDIALHTLVLGRAHTGLSLLEEFQGLRSRSLAEAATALAHLNTAVDGFREAGASEFAPLGFLARAAFRRSVGDWSMAVRDLDEVEEIAEPGPMKLFLCDMALERARLAFAQIEAFAPLNGMLEKDNPAKPVVPSAEEIATLKSEAANQIKIADDYIQSCGYHRRDEELAELKDVLAGKKTFASLPPRV
jgi:tetratricopeptide (TPR) repeat protein